MTDPSVPVQTHHFPRPRRARAEITYAPPQPAVAGEWLPLHRRRIRAEPATSACGACTNYVDSNAALKELMDGNRRFALER